MTDFERIVEFRPAWDRRDPDPKKDYGIHSMEIAFVLKGEDGAVQFVFCTGWLLPETLGINDPPEDSWKLGTMHKYAQALSLQRTAHLYPMVIDLGYHSKTPRYEDHSSYDCSYVDGGKCYYDGSSLNAEPVFLGMLKEGDDFVWNELEAYYKELFLEG